MMKIILLLLLLIIMFFIIVMIIDCHRLVVREYEFSIPGLKKDSTMVLLSDLHGVCFGKNNIRLLEKIRKCNPDMVVISGDMYTASINSGIDNARVFLEKLALEYNIYYADGNHEEKTKELTEDFGDRYESYVSYLSDKGINFMNNSHINIAESNLCVYGLALPFEYYKKFKSIFPDKEFLNELLGEAPKDKTVVLLAHNPEYFKNYAEWGADVVCSGHYHGGLMRLPIIGGVISPRYKLFPKYDYGVYEEGKSHMVLSCGLGTHTLPVRIFNPGEISLIRLKKEK